MSQFFTDNSKSLVLRLDGPLPPASNGGWGDQDVLASCFVYRWPTNAWERAPMRRTVSGEIQVWDSWRGRNLRVHSLSPELAKRYLRRGQMRFWFRPRTLRGFAFYFLLAVMVATVVASRFPG
jgi:hypothetical protein